MYISLQIARVVLAVMLAVVLLLARGAAGAHPGNASRVFNVVAFGARGDGRTDDSAAFQRAFDALGAAGAGQVRIPTGNFLLTKTVRCGSPGLFSLRGDGPGSNVLWSFDADMISFGGQDGSIVVAMATLSDFTVASVGANKSRASAALSFPADA